jgi:PAS domain S-box-containing protein
MVSRIPVVRILLVEDDEPVANLITRTLGGFGYLVMGVTDSGDIAVREAQGGKPDLVLMDIELRGPIDGIEAGDRIYHEFDIPVVFITALQDEQIFSRAKVAEPFGYLLKPFEDRQLRNVIEIALQQCRARRKRVDEAQHEAEIHYKTILHDTVVGIFRAKPTGEFLHANPELLQILGYDSYDALLAEAKNLSGALCFKSAKANGLKEIFGNANLPQNFALQAYRRDGSTIWVSGSTRVVRDTAGRAVYYEGSLMEVTQERNSTDASR